MVTPPGTAPFTPGNVASFRRAAAGWVRAGLCGAVLRTRADGADALLAMPADGSAVPLWAVEKHGARTYCPVRPVAPGPRVRGRHG